MGYDLKLDDIANKIIDAVLAERHIDRESLEKIILPILKIWIKCANGFKRQKAPKNKLQFTVEKKIIELTYWKEKVRELVENDNDIMQGCYDELTEKIENEGYTHYVPN